MSHKGRVIATAAAALLALGVAAAIVCANADAAVCMYINSMPVTVREYQQAVSGHRAHVYSHFYAAYGVSLSDDDLYHSFDGQVPARMLEEKAVAALVSKKVQQAEGMKYGLLASAEYRDLLKELAAENKERQAKLQRGEVIYGPQQYGEQEYATYVFSNMVVGLKEQLFTQWQPTEVQLREYYESGQSSLTAGYEIQAQRLCFPYAVGDARAREQARIKAEDAYARLQGGTPAEDITQAVIEPYHLSSQTERSLSESGEADVQQAKALQPGEYSPVYEVIGNFCILYCTAHTERLLPYEEVAEQVCYDWTEHTYAIWLEEQIAAAQVEKTWVFRFVK